MINDHEPVATMLAHGGPRFRHTAAGRMLPAQMPALERAKALPDGEYGMRVEYGAVKRRDACNTTRSVELQLAGHTAIIKKEPSGWGLVQTRYLDWVVSYPNGRREIRGIAYFDGPVPMPDKYDWLLEPPNLPTNQCKGVLLFEDLTDPTVVNLPTSWFEQLKNQLKQNKLAVTADEVKPHGNTTKIIKWITKSAEEFVAYEHMTTRCPHEIVESTEILRTDYYREDLNLNWVNINGELGGVCWGSNAGWLGIYFKDAAEGTERLEWFEKLAWMMQNGYLPWSADDVTNFGPNKQSGFIRFSPKNMKETNELIASFKLGVHAA